MNAGAGDLQRQPFGLTDAQQGTTALCRWDSGSKDVQQEPDALRDPQPINEDRG